MNPENTASVLISTHQGGPNVFFSSLHCDIWLGVGLASAVQNFPLHKYIDSRRSFTYFNDIKTAQHTVPKGALSSIKITPNVHKDFF